jgi:hypothetical protein
MDSAGAVTNQQHRQVGTFYLLFSSFFNVSVGDFGTLVDVDQLKLGIVNALIYYW